MDREKISSEATPGADDKCVIGPPESGGQTYAQNTDRQMYLHLENLQVFKEAHDFHFAGGEVGSPPAMSLYVQGKATLLDRSISVIGAPGNKTCTLTVGFNAFDEDIMKQRAEWARCHGMTPNFTHATVGFIARNPKVGNSGEWFAECEVAPQTLDGIVSSVSSGRLQAMTVGLALHGIYSDDWGQPPTKTNWYLRPSRRANTLAGAEKAYGDISRLSFELVSDGLRPRPGADLELDVFGDSTLETLAK